MLSIFMLSMFVCLNCVINTILHICKICCWVWRWRRLNMVQNICGTWSACDKGTACGFWRALFNFPLDDPCIMYRNEWFSVRESAVEILRFGARQFVMGPSMSRKWRLRWYPHLQRNFESLVDCLQNILHPGNIWFCLLLSDGTRSWVPSFSFFDGIFSTTPWRIMTVASSISSEKSQRNLSKRALIKSSQSWYSMSCTAMEKGSHLHLLPLSNN